MAGLLIASPVEGVGRTRQLCPGTSDLDFFCDVERVVYLDADLELKQRVLYAVTPLNGKPGRYQPDDKLFAFLKGL